MLIASGWLLSNHAESSLSSVMCHCDGGNQ
jgi:hypothetical protein